MNISTTYNNYKLLCENEDMHVCCVIITCTCERELFDKHLYKFFTEQNRLFDGSLIH